MRIFFLAAFVLMLAGYQMARADGQGTGFFVTTDGYLVTNHHVIKAAKEIGIPIDGKSIQAQVVAFDAVNDVALLKANTTSYPVPIATDSSKLARGEQVFILGFPETYVLGGELKVTVGHVSSLSGMRGDIRHIQLGIDIRPGNSGGPVIATNGQVIGIATATIRGSETIGYAVKVDYLSPLLRRPGVILPTIKQAAWSVAEIAKKYERSVTLVRTFSTMREEGSFSILLNELLRQLQNEERKRFEEERQRLLARIKELEEEQHKTATAPRQINVLLNNAWQLCQQRLGGRVSLPCLDSQGVRIDFSLWEKCRISPPEHPEQQRRGGRISKDCISDAL